MSLPLKHQSPLLLSSRPRQLKGQTLIEFVIVFMIFLMMAGFAVEIGNYFRARSLLTLATYSAARAFAVEQNMGYAKQCGEIYIKESCVPGTAFFFADKIPTFGQTFTMTGSMGYRPIVPWFSYFTSGNVTTFDAFGGHIYMTSIVHMTAD